jgi:hypothetical protein
VQARNAEPPGAAPLARPEILLTAFGHAYFDLVLINEYVVEVKTGAFQELLIFLIEADEFVNAGFNVHTVRRPAGCPPAHLWITLEDQNAQPALGKFKSGR